MNKELINKYKPEFDHFLNEGKILYKHIHSIAWWNDEPWDYSPVYITAIIINDEYSEFRKALAEGKTIEYLGQSSNVWHEVPEPDFILHPTCYRIKPDKPNFKVGDFVTSLNRDINCSVWQIDKILSCNTVVSGSTMLDPRTIQLWTPIKGEWCWFYDSKSSKSAALAKFNEKCNDKFIFNNNVFWQFCEPFLNSIPSYLKDK